MTITEILTRLPPRAVDSLAEVARSAMESDNAEHLTVLNREHGNVEPILTSVEWYWYREVVRMIDSDDAAMEVLLYDSSSHR